jgi:antitoxin MazE
LKHFDCLLGVHIMPAVAIKARGVIKPWGNGLAMRFTKAVSQAAGVMPDSAVRVTAQQGRIVIELDKRPMSLNEMLEGFDPVRHGGEVMAYRPIGAEVL